MVSNNSYLAVLSRVIHGNLNVPNRICGGACVLLFNLDNILVRRSEVHMLNILRKMRVDIAQYVEAEVFLFKETVFAREKNSKDIIMLTVVHSYSVFESYIVGHQFRIGAARNSYIIGIRIFARARIRNSVSLEAVNLCGSLTHEDRVIYSAREQADAVGTPAVNASGVVNTHNVRFTGIYSCHLNKRSSGRCSRFARCNRYGLSRICA